MPPSSLSKSPNFSEIYTGFPSKQKTMAAQRLFPFPFLVWLAGAHNYLALGLQQSGIPPARDRKLKDFILLWERRHSTVTSLRSRRVPSTSL